MKNILIKYIVPILIFVGFILAYTEYKNAKNKKEGYEKALRKATEWIIGYNLLGAFFVFNIFSKEVSASIGFTESQFIRELSFYHLGMSIALLIAINKNWNIESIKSISIIWIVFATLAGFYHIYEVVLLKNYSFNNIIPIFFDLISSGGLAFLVLKNN